MMIMMNNLFESSGSLFIFRTNNNFDFQNFINEIGLLFVSNLIIEKNETIESIIRIDQSIVDSFITLIE